MLKVSGLRVRFGVTMAIDGLDLARYDTAGLGSMQFSALAARIAAALSIQRFEQKQIVYISFKCNFPNQIYPY